MLRVTLIVACVGLLTSTANCEDTIADRVAAFEHFGIEVDSEISAYALHTYSAQQFEENIASLEQYEIDSAAHEERIYGLKKEVSEALNNVLKDPQNKDAYSEVGKRMKIEESKKPQPPFAQRIKLHRLRKIGGDYIALSPAHDSSTEILIPFSRIGRIVNRPPLAGTEGDGPK